MENLQEPVLQILYKYSKIYHPEDLQHFAHLIGRLTELRTLNHNYSEILSIWKTKDSKLASLLSEKWNLYSLWWNFRMLWFVLNFLNLDCLRYDHRILIWKTWTELLLRIEYIAIKWTSSRAHQILWNLGPPLEGHLVFFLRFVPKEAMVIVTAWFVQKGVVLNRVLTWRNSPFFHLVENWMKIYILFEDIKEII